MDPQGNILPLASIYLDGEERGTESDETGSFSMKVQTLKNARVRISYLGHLSRTLLAGEWSHGDCLDIELMADPHLFGYEILIQDYMFRGIEHGKAHGATQLHLDVLKEEYPRAQEDILRCTQILPGITSVDGSSTHLNIRGSTPDQNLLVWEGVTLYDPGHLFGMISSINPFMVNSVEVHKTAFDPAYSSRIGGVVDLSLTDDLALKPTGGIGTTLTEVHGDIHLPVGKIASISLAARQSLSSIIQTPTLISFSDKVFQDKWVNSEEDDVEESREIGLQEFGFWDVTGKVIIEPNAKWKLSTAFTQNENQFEGEGQFVEEELENEESITSRGKAFSLRLDRKWSNTFSSALKFVQSDYAMRESSAFSDGDTIDVPEQTLLTNNILDRRISLNNHWRGSRLRGQLGYEWEWKNATFELLENSIFLATQEDYHEASSAFHNAMASLTWVSDQHTIEAGIRATYATGVSSTFVSPRISWQFAPGRRWNLRLAAGRYFQFVSQLQNVDDVNVLNGIWHLAEESNEEVLASDKGSIGLTFESGNFMLDVEAFAQRVSGISSLTTGPTSMIENALGKSRAHGVDVLLQQELKPFRIWLSYSLLHHQFRISSIEQDWFAADNDHRHNLTAAVVFQHERWTATTSYGLRSGLPYSPVEGYQIIDEEEEEYRLQFGNLNSERLSAFHQLDASLTYRSTLPWSDTQMEINLSLLNLLNRVNPYARRTYLLEVDEDDQPDLFTVEKNHIRRTPQLLFRINF